MPKTKLKKPKYYLNPDGEFVIENYNFAKPFANFFPGIAGKYGIPMWTFYVNRAQGIASFGTKDKDHAILEFQPANKAWQLTSSHGFRTFIRLSSGKKEHIYEPFQNSFVNLTFNLKNKMQISPSSLLITEDNLTLGLRVKIEYFNIPNDRYAGLARILTISNLGNAAKKIRVIDGLPQIVPFGTNNFFLKKMSRTIEAWMQVKNLRKNVPYFKLDVDPSDRPELVHIKEGNFYLAFHLQGKRTKLLTPIVDPEEIFGPESDFSCPVGFLAKDKFRPAKEKSFNSKTPCAFSLFEAELGGKEEKTLFSLIGHARSQELLNSLIERIASQDYLLEKKKENSRIITELQNDINTESSSARFDFYTRQTYLDNILRGGYPVVFGKNNEHSTFYLYSRKHGDLERDYNKFQLQPSYFSQGNGNYRDANQNRRSDNWFNPEIEDENLIYFFNLVQTDGFNPLVVKGVSFVLEDENKFRESASLLVEKKYLPGLIDFLKNPYTPGDLVHFIEENHITVKTGYDPILETAIACSLKNQEAEHSEGFWSDHWTYNLDLLESYLAIFPEKLKEIVFEKKVFNFFDNSEVVRPRAEKYVLYNDKPRQLHAVGVDTVKREMIRKRAAQAHLVRSEYGNGQVYTTTLINKLLCLLANKFSSLDPFGTGIEMEANKPNWYDALNGLPGLFGSSICETFELKRLIRSIKNALLKSGVNSVLVCEEINTLLFALKALVKDYREDGSAEKDFIFWDKSCGLKEEYRQKTRFGLSGKENEVGAAQLLEILEEFSFKTELGIERALDKKKNVYYSYFINEAVDYEVTRDSYIRVKKFAQKPLAFFLEGQMHALRLSEEPAQSQGLYTATKKSALYDKKLKMYKVTASLEAMPEEIGRCRVFTPGWLENESIWLHMEYKYLLEILKQGLFEEFYREFRGVLVPFQDPQRYGRSILENSSFLVSSAFGKKQLHGNGFVARLSGSTAEFLEIWLLMNLGKKPFYLDRNNALCLRLRPVLAGWLFDRRGKYSFSFLSKVRVNYHNPQKKNTFGADAAKVSRIVFKDADGNPVEISGESIPSPYSGQIRQRLVREIDAYLY